MGVASDPAEADRLAAMGEGSVSRACGLADGELERFRRSMIDEIAAEHGFQPPELAGKVQAFVKQAGKETVNQRRRASLLIGELRGSFAGSCGRRPGWHPPAPIRRIGTRWRCWRIGSNRRTCWLPPIAASRRIITWHGRVYLPLVLNSLLHDLGKVVNPRG